MKWMLLWAQLYYILCFWCFLSSFNKTLSTSLQKRKCMPLIRGQNSLIQKKKKKNLHKQTANQLVHPTSGEFLEIATEFERFGLQKKNYLMCSSYGVHLSQAYDSSTCLWWSFHIMLRTWHNCHWSSSSFYTNLSSQSITEVDQNELKCTKVDKKWSK